MTVSQGHVIAVMHNDLREALRVFILASSMCTPTSEKTLASEMSVFVSSLSAQKPQLTRGIAIPFYGVPSCLEKISLSFGPHCCSDQNIMVNAGDCAVSFCIAVAI